MVVRIDCVFSRLHLLHSNFALTLVARKLTPHPRSNHPDEGVPIVTHSLLLALV